MIRMEQVARTYTDFHLEVDLTVEQGRIVTLLGHSGSGKTTTLRILAGFERSDTGRILLAGEDVTTLPAEERGIGYVFQDYTLFPHLDVGKNIAYGLRVKKVSSKDQRRRVDELLELVGLEGFAKRPTHTLSGGEQQRVAVARALAPDPRALLLDEPFSAIDTERRESLRRHLIRIQRELRIPTVFVTHSRTEALFLSDHILVLRDGRVEDQGSPQDLYARPRTEYAARFLGAANILESDTLKNHLPRMPQTRTLLMIRPENVKIGDTGPLTGRITDHAYYGAWWEYTLETPLGPILVVTRKRYEKGATVRIDLPPDDLTPVTPASTQASTQASTSGSTSGSAIEHP